MRLSIGIFICVGVTYLLTVSNSAQAQQIPAPPKGAIRIATFNMALNRSKAGELSSGLQQGDEQAKKIAAIVQLVRPDVLLANEVDFDGGQSAKLLADKYLNANLEGLETEPLKLVHWFTAEVNTGVQSGLNLTGTGKTGKPEDAWGFGAFPGQYGMVVYSRFPFQENKVRTFQKFLWSDMPNALSPGVGKPNDESWKPYYSDEIWKQLRLSSKSHWDVPVNIDGRVLHVLASHPTPPVFDGPEDRNGRRNHDEIRFFCDYIDGLTYMVDDRGNGGGLDHSAEFVVLGDLNADPNDGDGLHAGIDRLLKSKRINASFVPTSKGAVEAAAASGQANAKHQGNPSHDTGDFNDRNPGNLRIDFVLPSSGLKLIGGGVFWPTNDEIKSLPIDVSDASDHHMVWIDIQFP
jgi:3-phytase